jgi:hypothetical protein
VASSSETGVAAGHRAAAVVLLVHGPGQRPAPGPAGPGQLGLGREALDVADAEVGDDLQVLGQAEGLGELTLVEEGDPADAEALGAGGEPEVLHGEAGGERRHHRLRVAAEGVPAAAGRIAGHDDVDRGLEDRLDLERGEGLRARLGQRGGVRAALTDRQVVHGPAALLVAQHQEVPGLGEADRGRGVRGLEDPGEDLGGQLVGQEVVADVAPLVDDAVDGLERLLAVTRRAAVVSGGGGCGCGLGRRGGRGRGCGRGLRFGGLLGPGTRGTRRGGGGRGRLRGLLRGRAAAGGRRRRRRGGRDGRGWRLDGCRGRRLGGLRLCLRLRLDLRRCLRLVGLGLPVLRLLLSLG